MSTLVHEMQDAIDEHKESLGDGAYVLLCNSLKELHKATALRRVYYYEFSSVDGLAGVVGIPHVRIMEVSDVECQFPWKHAFEDSTLPTDMGLSPLHVPFSMGNSKYMVMSIEPYLKRSREDDGEDDGEDAQ